MSFRDDEGCARVALRANTEWKSLCGDRPQADFYGANAVCTKPFRCPR